MASEISTIGLTDLTKNATILFAKGMDDVAKIMRESGIFRVMDIPQNTGDTREFSEFELERYASRKPEGDQASRAKIQQGYTKVARLYRVAKDVAVTYEARTRSKYPEIIAELTNLGSLAYNAMELDMSHRLTFGEDTTYTDRDGEVVDITTGDGLALFDTAHTLKGTATTYSNQLAANPSLSRASLEAAESMGVQQGMNHFGQKMARSFDVLFTTDDPATMNVARELLQSTASIASGANSGVTNVYEGKYRHVSLPLLATNALGGVDTTKATYWGLVASRDTSAYLGMHEEPRMKTPDADQGEDFNTDDVEYGVRAGYFVVVVGSRWVVFSNGSGA